MIDLSHIAEGLRGLAVEVDSLHADPANARKGHAVERIAASLRQYGQRKPIVVNRLQGNKVEAGNGTLSAARLLGWSHVAAVFVEDDAATATGFGIADNRTGDLSEWDLEALDSLLGSIDPDEIFTGFEAGELDDLLEEAGKGKKGDGQDAEPQVDRAEELRQEWGVEPGQLWRLPSRTPGQEHRLICGDCTDAAVVERVMGGDVPLLMVTDPPYGVEYDPNWRNEAAAAGKLSYAASRIGQVDNDDRAEWSEAWRLFPGDVAYTWSPGGDHVIITGQALQAAGFEIRAMLIWKKPHIPISRGHYCYQHEPVWYAVKKGATAHWIGEKMSSSIWDIGLDKNIDGGHSTQKPLECMARPIRNHDSPLVYDPFLGSGTTLIAAENLSRQCRAVEISPGYVAVALQRYLDAFGIRGELVE